MDIEKLLGLKKNNAEDESVPEFLARPIEEPKAPVVDQDAINDFIAKYKQQKDSEELADVPDQLANPKDNIDASKYTGLVQQLARNPQDVQEVPTASSILPEAPKLQNEDYLKMLKDAQEHDRLQQRNANIGKAATLIGHSIAGVSTPKEMLEGFDSGKSKVTELHNQLQMKEQQGNLELKEAMRDPNSNMSKKARELLAQAGVSDIPDSISIEQLDKMGLNISNLMTQKNAHDLKRELASAKTDSQKDLAALKGGKKEQDTILKAIKDMDEMKASSRSGMGREVNRLNQGTHVLGILGHYKNLDDVPESIKKEAAVGLATMVSPGLPHEATIAAMDPKTLQQTLTGYLSYITGSPYGAGAGGNLDMVRKSLQNQMGISRDLLQKHQKQFLQGYKATMPEDSYGKLEGIIKSKDLFKGDLPESEQLSSEDQKAVDWAKENKDDPRAQKILKLHGL
jgi:hypothetical protein